MANYRDSDDFINRANGISSSFDGFMDTLSRALTRGPYAIGQGGQLSPMSMGGHQGAITEAGIRYGGQIPPNMFPGAAGTESAIRGF